MGSTHSLGQQAQRLGQQTQRHLLHLQVPAPLLAAPPPSRPQQVKAAENPAAEVRLGGNWRRSMPEGRAPASSFLCVIERTISAHKASAGCAI